MDLWGLGCVLAEMIGGEVLFPGTSTMDQLRCIMQITGRPTAEDIQSVGSPIAEIIMGDVEQTEPQALSERYPEASAESLDMIRMLLQFNPSRRIRVTQALRHPMLWTFTTLKMNLTIIGSQNYQWGTIFDTALSTRGKDFMKT